MKISKTIPVVILGLIFLFACDSGKVEKFSKEKPYAIEIAKERSFYQAEKLKNRLTEMGVKAYMVQHADSTEDAGKWYYILSNSIAVLDTAKSVRSRLEKDLELEDLKIVSYDDFKDAVFQLDSLKQKEKKKISSNKPDVKEDIFKVINKFPESNSLLVQKTFVINTPSNPDDMKGFSTVYSFQMDLPRGISTEMMLNKTTAFSEVIYQDNLYGDRVTIDIGKLRNTKPIKNHASILNSENKKNFEIAEPYADLILETGDYLFEEKKEIEIKSYAELYGYKVTIEPKKDYFRTYYVLVDESNQYIFFIQSIDKTKEELNAIISDIGQGKGLLNYNEFYNTFYTLPDTMVSNDMFIGFTIDKLGWSYAKRRGYAEWSKEMVGYWKATGYFFNEKKGVWAYSNFDLLTPSNQNYIYGTLYSKDSGENKQKVNVYDTEGFVIYQDKFNSNTWETYKKTSEISFGIDRYVSAVNNTENSMFKKEDLIKRAESLQFEKSN